MVYTKPTMKYGCGGKCRDCELYCECDFACIMDDLMDGCDDCPARYTCERDHETQSFN